MQTATASMYKCTNYDINRLLMKQTGEYLVKCTREDIFPKFIFYLDLSKVRGVEKNYGLNIIFDYITWYTCKGGDSSVVWGDIIKWMLDTYIDTGNQDGNLRSLVATIMNNVSKQHAVSRLEWIFTLCGGKLERSSFGFTQICSINEADLKSVRDEALPPTLPLVRDFQPTLTVSNQYFI